MVAYSFQKQFVKPILAGIKTQTIRSDRARHARPGEDLQLYTGMRTKHCKLITRARCIQVDMIRMHLTAWSSLIEINGQLLSKRELVEALAIKDGFKSWQEMRRFWFNWHGQKDSDDNKQVDFKGVVICWDPASIHLIADAASP
jgi:hypothetical protein